RFAILLLAAALCIASAPAAAHAFLDHALPAVGSTVHEAPRAIRLWFTEQLEPAFSSVRVLDKSGKEVDAGDSHVDAADPMVLVASAASTCESPASTSLPLLSSTRTLLNAGSSC